MNKVLRKYESSIEEFYFKRSKYQKKMKEDVKQIVDNLLDNNSDNSGLQKDVIYLYKFILSFLEEKNFPNIQLNPTVNSNNNTLNYNNSNNNNRISSTSNSTDFSNRTASLNGKKSSYSVQNYEEIKKELVDNKNKPIILTKEANINDKYKMKNIREYNPSKENTLTPKEDNKYNFKPITCKNDSFINKFLNPSK